MLASTPPCIQYISTISDNAPYIIPREPLFGPYIYSLDSSPRQEVVHHRTAQHDDDGDGPTNQ